MSFTIIKKNSLPKSEFEIEGEIHADAIKPFRADAIKSLSEGVKMDGFRPGKIPEKAIVDRFGEMSVAEEMGRLALEKHYFDIMENISKDDAGIHPIGSPKVSITKVAPGEAFGFKITTAVMPKVSLSDYSSIAKKINSKEEAVEVTEKEVEETIKDLQKQAAHDEFHKNEQIAKTSPDGQAEHEDHTDHLSESEHDHEGGHDHGDLPLPEVNEEFIKKFGAFESVEKFKEKIKENILGEKKRREKDKARLRIMDAILEKTTVEVPQLLVDSELKQMMGELSSSVAQMGLNTETYLKHVQKTADELQKEWLPEAQKRAKTDLILAHIATAEKLAVTEEELTKEVEALLKYYKDIDPSRARAYIEMSLQNEKVWQFLENTK